MSAETLPLMKAALEKAGTKHEMERFPGTHHGFCFVEREVCDLPPPSALGRKPLTCWCAHCARLLPAK